MFNFYQIDTREGQILAIILIASLALYWYFKEWKRVPKSRLGIRLCSITLLVLGISILLFPPNRSYEKEKTTFLVIDESLSDLNWDRLYPNTQKKIYSKQGKNRQKGYINSLVELFDENFFPETIILAGTNFDLQELKYANKQASKLQWDSLSFHSTVYKINRQLRASVGEEWLYELYFSDTASYHYCLKLGNETLDSASFQHQLKISNAISAVGKIIYHMYIYDKDSLLSIEEIPVEGKGKFNAKIAFIIDQPAIEKNALKRFLMDRNHQVGVRQKITEGVYKYEYIQGAFSLENPNYYSKYDLIIFDSPAWMALGENAKNQLLQVILEEGMGVLILADESIFNYSDQVFKSASWIPISSKKEYFYGQKYTNETWVNQNNDKIEWQRGNGKIAVSLLKDTYKVKMQGDSLLYEKLWMNVMSSLLKPDTNTLVWPLDTQYFSGITNDVYNIFPFYKKNRLTSESSNDDYANWSTVHPNSAWKYRKMFIPDSGWQSVGNVDSILSTSIYIYDSKHNQLAQAYQAANRTRRMKIALNQYELGTSVLPSYQMPLSLFWPFSLILFSLALLWLEEKM